MKNDHKAREISRLPLLQSKLASPVTKCDLVPRSKMKQWIKASRPAKVVLIRAPAGFGKTTLMMQWQQELLNKGQKVAWLNLDAEDNDPGRILSYLGKAIEKAFYGDRDLERSRLLLNSPGLLSAMLLDLLELLQTGQSSLSVFIDNFEVVSSPDVFGLIRDLIRKAPDNIKFFMALRAFSNNGLEDLCDPDRVVEIDAEALRFSAKETKLFVRNTRKLNLPAEDLDFLQQFTEGWVAGLQLTTLTRNWRELPADHVSPFAGAFGRISDYLAEDVLASQSGDVQNFLLQTSILRRLSAPLCDALTNRDDSAAMIAQLDDANLFLSPLDKDRQWYRYHSLFSRFLQNRLERGRRDQLERLHAAAAEWHAEHGDILEAVRHALAAHDNQRAAAYLEEAAPELVEAGHLQTVVELGERLPLHELDNHPFLLISYGYSLLLLQQYEKVTEVLETLSRLDHEDKLPEKMVNDLHGLKALLLLCQDRLEECESFTQSVMPDFEVRPVSSLALINIKSGLLLARNRFQEAERCIAFGYSQSKELGDTVSIAYNRITAAFLAMTQGRMRQALACLEREHAEISAGPGRYSDAGASVAVFMAEILYEMNRLEEARTLLEPYLAIMPILTPPDVTIICLRTMARICLAEDNYSDARHHLRRLMHLSAGSGIQRGVASAQIEDVRMDIQRGDIEGAIQKARRQNFAPLWKGFSGWQMTANDPETQEISNLRLMVAEGRHADALDGIRQALKKAESVHRFRQVLLLRILQAKALEFSGERVAALGALKKALLVAQDEGVVRVFVDSGEPLPQLLHQLRTQSDGAGAVSPEFVDHLLFSMGATQASKISEREGDAPVLLDPLTDRELEILKKLDRGFSNEALADELSVSINTIRYHLRNINTKLGSGNRTQALAFARQLGIIR